jgi:putative hydrolase of the HAD superfamily
VSVLFFDLDNTLYPRSSGLLARIDQRIDAYLRARIGIPEAEVHHVRRRYWREHGTTLRGLMRLHAVDADDYLEYVHDVDLVGLEPDPRLRVALERLPHRKAVFSNASRGHANRVLLRLGLQSAFESVLGLEDLAYVPKPAEEAFRVALGALGARPEVSALIDDLRANLAAAKRLGMRTIWVAEGEGGTRDETVDHVVSSVHEIEPLLAEVCDARV